MVLALWSRAALHETAACGLGRGGSGRSLRLRLPPGSQAENSRQGKAAPQALTVPAPRPGRGQCRGLGGNRELSAWQRPRVAGLARGPGMGPSSRRGVLGKAGQIRAGPSACGLRGPRASASHRKLPPNVRALLTPEPGAAGKPPGRVWRLRPCPDDGAAWLPAPRTWGSSRNGAHRACRADPQICILSGDKICSRIFS